MKRVTKEWVAKAEGDFATMARESRVRKLPNYDAVCFHAQQCVEKYLKARLCEAGIKISKTHDLVALLESALSVEPFWESFRESLAYLSDYAVNTGYPGDSATKAAAEDTARYCRSFRKTARASLKLRTKK